MWSNLSSGLQSVFQRAETKLQNVLDEHLAEQAANSIPRLAPLAGRQGTGEESK